MADPQFSRREREALCDLALTLGEDAPTLCTGWNSKDLVVHLLVRERSVFALPGALVPQLRWLVERESARYARRRYADLVASLRSTRFTPVAIPAVDRVFNSAEFFIHHEDLRRAQPGWAPRELVRRDQSMLWSALRYVAPGVARRAGMDTPLTMRRTDKGSEFAVVTGEDPVVLSGLPAELLLFAFGRPETSGLDFAGPDEAVAAVRSAVFSV